MADRPTNLVSLRKEAEVVAVPHKIRREPRLRIKSVHLLRREDRIREAVKIIDDNRRDKGGERCSCKDSIANILDWLEFACTGQRVLRRASSKKTSRADAQVAAWLRKGVILLNSLYLWPPGFENFRDEVRRWATVYEAGERIRPVRKPTPSAYEKRFAAEAALHLCEEFGIKLTTTKRGAFCTLAAVLLGDRHADLQKQCAKVLAPNYRTWLARRAPNRGGNCSGLAP